ncbi:IS66 family transposase [bacterium]|nr:IS66 family transposase [bacterium]
MTAATAQRTEAKQKKAKPAGCSSTRFADMSEGELDALIDRIEQAKTHSLALSAADYELLLGAILMLANLQERLEGNDLSIHKLRKLLGMVSSSEKLRDLLPATDNEKGQDSGTDTKTGKSGTGKGGRSGKKNKPKKKPKLAKPELHEHALDGMNKGDRCPSCGAGKLYKYKPAVLLRVIGHAPFSSHRHEAQQMRCNGCNEIFTADLPEHVKADGAAGQQYAYSARSVMAISKYFAASPFYRQEQFNGLLGAPIAASTVFDQCEKVADALLPVFKLIKRQAANAEKFYLDDTTNRILDQQPVMKKGRDGRERLRSGIYTSAVLAITEEGRRLVLFQTNIGHAGEWMQEILSARDAARAPPLLMSDALSANHVIGHTFDKCLCNSHGRRSFVDLIDQCPKKVLHALELYQHAWVNDTHCEKNQFSPKQRLDYHREHSLPPMQELLAWCHQQLDDDTVEHNSNLGKAMQYIIRHFEGLTAFCRIVGAPVDNNEIERLIKVIVRNRKNSLFFKTSVGADISDVITSMLVMCHENDINAYYYLNSIQRNQLLVKASPEKWLPWNYPTDM